MACAFSYCSALEEIEIFGNVEVIGEGAFRGCTSLQSVIIHEGVKKIWEVAFEGCSSLKKIVLPASLELIDGTAFVCASQSLEEIVLDEKNEKFILVDGCLIEKESGTLVLKCADAKIPDDGSIKIIGSGVFSGHDEVTEIKIPASVEQIGAYAFNNCVNLKTAVIPEGVMVIGAYAFCNCPSLVSVYVPASLTEMGSYAFSKCTALTDVGFAPRDENADINFSGWIFYECTSLVSFTFPEGITETGSYMFYKCTSLERVVLPQTLKVLRQSFADCENLKAISIPASVTRIHTSAFSSAKLIEVLNYEGTKAQWNKYASTSRGWNSGSNIKIVRCSDGDIEIAD